MCEPAGPGLLDAADLGFLSPDALESALQPLFEKAGPVARVLAGRHFGSWEEVLVAVEAELASSSAQFRAAVLRAHPRLGERPDRLRATSPASWGEQRAGGESPSEVLDELAGLSDSYEARFGFPFVEWVNGRPLSDMIAVLHARMENDADTELESGCQALVDIARDRLSRLRAASQKS